VEKSEIEVLKGIEPEHWPLISQAVVEVRDLDGQVAEAARILESAGFRVQRHDRRGPGQAGMPMLYARRSATAHGPQASDRLQAAREAGPQQWLNPDELTADIRAALRSWLP